MIFKIIVAYWIDEEDLMLLMGVGDVFISGKIGNI